MKKYLLLIIIFFSLKGMEFEGIAYSQAPEESATVHTKDNFRVIVPFAIIKNSKYLSELYSRSSGFEFDVDLTRQELDLLVNILQHPAIFSGISQNLINLIPFTHLTRKEFFDLITKFGLPRDSFANLWTLVREYTLLIGENNFVYPIRNTDIDKIPTYRDLKEDLPDKRQWVVRIPFNINTKIIDMVVALLDVSSFQIVQEKLESWSAQEAALLTEIFNFLGLPFQTKTCFIVLALKEKNQQRKIDSVVKTQIPITLKDLQELGILPSIRQTKVKVKDGEVQGGALDLSGYGLSEITDITHYFSIEELNTLFGLDLSFNRLKDFSSLPEMEELLFLDLSFNNIQVQSLANWFKNTPHLLTLFLQHNNISFADIEAGWAQNLKNLSTLNLSNNRGFKSDANAADLFTPGWSLGLSGIILSDPHEDTEKIGGGLKNLDLSYNGIRKLWSGWAKGLRQLRKLDLRGNPIKELEKGWAQGLKNLQEIIIDKNSPIKNSMNWELNGILAYFGIRKSKVKIIERETEKELA